MGGKIGVFVEVNCETDFVAKTEDFQALAGDISLAGRRIQSSLCQSGGDFRKGTGAGKRDLQEPTARREKTGKDLGEDYEGKLKKYFEEVCLLDQKFIKNTDITVGTLVSNMIAKTGENIIVRRFARFQLGEEQK